MTEPTSIDKGAVVARGERHRPSAQAQVVVSPELDCWQPEAAGVNELPQPRPGALAEAHQVTAMCLVLGEFLPRVRRASGRRVEVVVDAGVLIALDEERVKPEPARAVHCDGRLIYRSRRQLSGSFTSIGHRAIRRSPDSRTGVYPAPPDTFTAAHEAHSQRGLEGK